MNASQYGNQMLQSATPWKYLKDDTPSQERTQSLSDLAFGWRIARFLAITTQPFMPFSAQRLWESLGQKGDVSAQSWHSAIDWDAQMTWDETPPNPLFKRLELDEILASEQALAEATDVAADDPGHGVKGGKKKKQKAKGDTKMPEAPEGTTYLEFDTFMKVDLRVGKITSVEDHPNADRLYVVTIDDGSDKERTICAGLKAFYAPEQMMGKSVVFVANLKPRPLRGVVSEGMMLAADDGNDNVRLITIDGDMTTGAQVR
jgi:methionyl-tRNA synthetase